MPNIKIALDAIKVVGPKLGGVIKKRGPQIIKLGAEALPVILDQLKKSGVTLKNLKVSDAKNIFNKSSQNQDANRVFKYSLNKLSELHLKNKIRDEVFVYLANELRHNGELFRQDARNFEKHFDEVIKAKDDKILSEKIRRYEFVRDVWIENNNS